VVSGSRPLTRVLCRSSPPPVARWGSRLLPCGVGLPGPQPAPIAEPTRVHPATPPWCSYLHHGKVVGHIPGVSPPIGDLGFPPVEVVRGSLRDGSPPWGPHYGGTPWSSPGAKGSPGGHGAWGPGALPPGSPVAALTPRILQGERSGGARGLHRPRPGPGRIPGLRPWVGPGHRDGAHLPPLPPRPEPEAQTPGIPWPSGPPFYGPGIPTSRGRDRGQGPQAPWGSSGLQGPRSHRDPPQPPTGLTPAPGPGARTGPPGFQGPSFFQLYSLGAQPNKR
jgi:hypothetical protein